MRAIVPWATDMSRIVAYDERGHGLRRRPAPTRQRRTESDPGRTGLPHRIGLSGANLHGSQALQSLVRGSRPSARADAYGSPATRYRIARTGVRAGATTERRAGLQRRQPNGSSELSPLNVAEIRRLISRLTDRRPTRVDCILHWSHGWRRRCRYQARISHYERRGHSP